MSKSQRSGNIDSHSVVHENLCDESIENLQIAIKELGGGFNKLWAENERNLMRIEEFGRIQDRDHFNLEKQNRRLEELEKNISNIKDEWMIALDKRIEELERAKCKNCSNRCSEIRLDLLARILTYMDDEHTSRDELIDILKAELEKEKI